MHDMDAIIADILKAIDDFKESGELDRIISEMRGVQTQENAKNPRAGTPSIPIDGDG
ncbi:hypothetical protein [Paracoccus sp. (in: a-proteobacteria)]|uniref:hypothetical protein n=1 Tax=Paracoccus sp. TaxID=267 RepID=UPI002AFE67B5|nr:hypothetical protein [Paracoccus sp. (in: a-proteobacteria)]